MATQPAGRATDVVGPAHKRRKADIEGQMMTGKEKALDDFIKALGPLIEQMIADLPEETKGHVCSLVATNTATLQLFVDCMPLKIALVLMPNNDEHKGIILHMIELPLPENGLTYSFN